MCLFLCLLSLYTDTYHTINLDCRLFGNHFIVFVFVVIVVVVVVVVAVVVVCLPTTLSSTT